MVVSPNVTDCKPALPQLHVAVGIVINAQREVLITQRARHKDEGGLWEFPGGKLEATETVLAALTRELYEEVGIVVQEAQPLLQITQTYPSKSILLDVWQVIRFEGTAFAREQQPLRWVAYTALPDIAFPVANKVIVEKILTLFTL